MKILPVLGKQTGVEQYWKEMQSAGVEVDEKNPDYIVVLGGDGTFLGAEREYYHLGVPFVGVGFGQVNFLLNRSIGSAQEFVEKLKKQIWIKFSMFAMEAEIETRSGWEKSMAFNDIYLKALDPTGVARLDLETLEYNHLGVVGDGLIIATPQGSTAYNHNAGGATLPLGSTLWALTGICTSKKIGVAVVQQEIHIAVKSAKVALVTDNKIFYDVQKVKIVPSSEKSVICFSAEENFEQRRYEI
jgi:NAD+ kinase